MGGRRIPIGEGTSEPETIVEDVRTMEGGEKARNRLIDLFFGNTSRTRLAVSLARALREVSV